MGQNKGQQIGPNENMARLALLHDKIWKNMIEMGNIFLIMYIPVSWELVWKWMSYRKQWFDI